MSVVIKVENLSKAYQLGEFSTGTISRDLERWWAKTRGKEDPFLKIGELNDRNVKSTSNVVWSLKDINFEIEQGDAVGIIGKNGAGKSTLLKILSRITAPSTGHVKIKGRVASLLEVGTGFHPELTGGENIYLNGAILGMRKKEIKKHFDAIVAFAGIERYVDTPVKRYSSGMYVRLAFAVAAHLESEILIVDEVLAVGDAEFQAKCIGKMNQVSTSEGRTVLFVSHNMGAVNQLCKKGILLKNGLVTFTGRADQAVTEYLRKETNAVEIDPRSVIGPLADHFIFDNLTINNKSFIQEILVKPSEEMQVKVKGKCIKELQNFRFSINIYKEGSIVFTLHDSVNPYCIKAGNWEINYNIPKYLLRPGNYIVTVGGHQAGPLNSSTEWVFVPDVCSFDILEEWDDLNDFNNKGFINLISKDN
jgi:lipopolysaccharide transport system ATP-binding protein